MTYLILKILIAALAVFGFYCAVQTVMDLIFSARRFQITIKIKNEKDADMLDMLLHEAQSAFFRKKSPCAVVSISSSLFEREIMGSRDGVLFDRYSDLIEQYRAECYVMDWD